MATIKIYEMVTERIVEKIREAIARVERGETGTTPWQQPWHGTGKPMNLITKKPYRGFNVFFLACLGYASPYFVSFNQVRKLGGKVKPGEHGYPVVFWKWVVKDTDEDGNKLDKPKSIPFLRYYTVFNVEQTEGIDPKKIPTVTTREFNPIAEGDAIIENMPHRPTMEHAEARAYYRPSTDTVNLPKHELFATDAAYYATAFHELVHSTGHTSRLNRVEVMDHISFGSHSYSREELVAEMGSVYLMNEIGLDSTMDNSLAYLKGWLTKLQDDVKLLIVAAGRAQKAVDYILGTQNKPATEETTTTNDDDDND